MSLTYGFFNSLDGDRVYTAENVNTMFEGLISNGVYANFQDAFKVNAAGGLNITVGTGRAVVGNRWVKNDAAITLTLNAAHVTLNRYTKICLRADTGTRTVSLLAVDGENGSSPVKPAPVRTSTQYDAVLAYVYVPAGASVITASQIQDTRADTSVCGFVASLVQQLDTSELFTQYEAAYEEQLDDMHDWQEQKEDDFDSWFGTLTDDLLVQTYVESGRAVSCANLSDLTKITVPETLPFDMAAGDILQLYIGGILLPKDRYTVALTSGAYVVTYPAGFISGNPVEFVMYKSVIGYNSQSGGGGGGGGGLSQTEKNLLLTLASKSAYAENDADTAYDALETIWSTTSYSVSWSGNGYTKGNNATSVIEGSTFTSTVTANTGFEITSVTATMGGATVTGAWSGGTVTIPNVTGNIVITVVTSQRTATSISAVYTQTGTVYNTDSLDSLKADLVVTATFSDSTTGVISAEDYTLSGTLEVGTSTITVSYAGLTDTFTVTVTRSVLLQSYDFTQGLTDSVGGNVATLSGAATQDSSGVHLSSASSYVTMPDLIKADGDVTIEFDMGDMTKGFSGVHGRLIMWDSTSGLIYRNSGSWQVYNGSAWETTTDSVTDANYYSNKTIKLRVGAKKSASVPKSDMEIIVDGASVWSKTEYYRTDTAKTIYLGSSATAFYNCTIKAVRVYEGER